MDRRGGGRRSRGRDRGCAPGRRCGASQFATRRSAGRRRPVRDRCRGARRHARARPDHPSPRRRTDLRCLRRCAQTRDHQAQPPAPREPRGARSAALGPRRGSGDRACRRRARSGRRVPRRPPFADRPRERSRDPADAAYRARDRASGDVGVRPHRGRSRRGRCDGRRTGHLRRHASERRPWGRCRPRHPPRGDGVPTAACCRQRARGAAVLGPPRDRRRDARQQLECPHRGTRDGPSRGGCR